MWTLFLSRSCPHCRQLVSTPEFVRLAPRLRVLYVDDPQVYAAYAGGGLTGVPVLVGPGFPATYGVGPIVSRLRTLG